MNRVKRAVIGALVPVVIIALYWIWTAAEPSPFFPPIYVMFARFQELWVFAHVGTDVLPSLTNLVLGYAVGSVAGIAIGTALGRFLVLRFLFLPLLDFGRSIPAIMLIPPFVLILGIGDASKIWIIALGTFFPVVISTIDGIRATDSALIDVCRGLGLGRLKELQVAWLPSATPMIAGGMQNGLQFALVLMVASEMLGAYRGLGYITMQAQGTFDSPSVWAGILLLAILGFAINAFFNLLRNRVLAWHIGLRRASSSN